MILIFVFLFAVDAFSAIDFSQLLYDYSNISESLHYQARDKAELDYRYYSSNSKDLLIVIHGSGYHGRYLHKLASEVSQKNIAQVLVPDLRGHGMNPRKRGDVDYIGQLDDDLDDLIRFSIATYKPHRIFMAGHSSGGGLALRLMGNKKRYQADGYILLAPYLKHDAPTTNSRSGWAKPLLARIILANILNAFGCGYLNHAVTIKFDLPEKYRDGSETLSYTHAMINSYTPVDYKEDLKNTSRKTLVLVGRNDEAMVASAFQEVIPRNMKLVILPKLTHMGLVVSDQTTTIIGEWIKAINRE